MIYYLVTQRHSYTMAAYLESWGGELARQLQIVPYGSLMGNREFPAGTYVFSDLERLPTVQRALLADVRDQLLRASAPIRLLNDPGRTLRRFGLLRQLHARGSNRFTAYRPDEPGRPWRYPVFVREENEHTGSLTGVLRDEGELGQALLGLIMQGYDPGALLVVEFCDTADGDGVYRKFSAFRVGDRILPRHVLFSRSWVVKDLDLLEPHHLEELRAYCRTNPHEHELRSIFDLAEVRYGRIDYSLLHGAVQVWEINTNPIIARPREKYPAFSQNFHEAFAGAFNQALLELNTSSDSVPGNPISWNPERAFHPEPDAHGG